MSSYSIVILICSMALSHSECQLNNAIDVVRGPQVDNVVMCSLNAQMMLARTDLAQGEGQYMKVVCAPTKSFDQWKAELDARKSGELE